MKKFIAVTFEGKEYMYRPRYMLKDGEKWKVYNCGGGQVYAEHQRFCFRSGKLCRIADN